MGEVPSRQWVQSLVPRGRRVLVEVALAAARSALPTWEASHGTVSEPRETLEAVAAWLREPTGERAHEVAQLTSRRGDPDDIDGFWLVVDGRTVEPAPTEAYCAAEYAGSAVFCPSGGLVDLVYAAIGCARRAGVRADALEPALARAAAVDHPALEEPPLPSVAREASASAGRVGRPDVGRAPRACPTCGGDALPVGPKESVAGLDHHPYECISCGAAFDVEGGPSLSGAHGPKS